MASARLMGQTLTNPRMVLTGSDPSTLSVGDFNNDGKPDLAYLDATSPSTLHILLGNGDGTFQHGQDIVLPFGIGGSITVADINKDGRQDILIGGGNQFQAQVGVFLGAGDGTFGPVIISNFAKTFTAFADIPFRFGVADFNGDGAADVVVLDPLNQFIFVLLGDNTGAFTLKTTIGNSGAPVIVLTGDFNGDGHPDFLVRTGLDSAVSVYLGNGDGTFNLSATYPNIGSVVLADVDGDGHVDMVATQPGSVEIFHGNPDGTFATRSSGGANLPTSNASVIAVADFNGDGILDLAVLSSTGINILLGKGSLTYGPPTTVVAGPFPRLPILPILSDLNLDGHLDFAVPAPDGIALLLGNGDGTFQSFDIYSVPNVGFTVADFNNDHVPDIAVGLPFSGASVLLGTGSGKFILSPNSIQAPAGFSSLVTGDFNGDGSADILSLDAKTILFGKGDGTFSSPLDLSLSVPGLSIAGIGDFNHDGKQDILAKPQLQEVQVLLGQSANAFLTATTTFPFTLETMGSAASADFNHDGNLDAIFASSLDVHPFLGNGDGTFRSAPSAATSIPGDFRSPTVLAAADLDGDGNADFITIDSTTPEALIFFGKGDGTFESPVVLPLSRGFLQLLIVDMNADGKPDLVLSNASVISVIHNTGGRSFGPEVHYLAGDIGSINVHDLNGDGLPDIVANTGLGLAVLLSHTGNPTAAGTLTSAPNPAIFGQPLSATLTLSPATATGSVIFSIDGRPIGNVPVTAGVATFTASTTSGFAVGAHNLTATYSGDSSFTSAIFSAPLKVGPVIHPTSVSLTATPSPVVASQTVRFTVTVSSVGPTPSGLVEIHDGTTNLGTVGLAPTGVAIFDYSLLAAGTHSVTALYQGDVNSAPGSSSSVSLVVNAFATTTSLAILPPAPGVGSSFALSGTVTSASGTPAGSVSFFDGIQLLGVREADSSGTAVFISSLSAPGTHSFTATYNANGPFATSVSNAQILSLAGATLTSRAFDLSVEQDPSSENLMLTAQLKPQSALAGDKVLFFADNIFLGGTSITLEGTATLEVAGVFPGSHYFTAVLPGDSPLATSAATTLAGSAISGKPEFAMLLSSSSVSLTANQPALLQLELDPINGFQGPIEVACSQSAEVSCTFRPSSMTSMGKWTLILTRIPQAGSSSAPHYPLSYLFPGAMGICVLASILAFARQRERVAGVVLGLVCLGALVGCGGKEQTPTGSSTIRISASSSQAALSLSHSVTLRVSIH